MPLTRSQNPKEITAKVMQLNELRRILNIIDLQNNVSEKINNVSEKGVDSFSLFPLFV